MRSSRASFGGALLLAFVAGCEHASPPASSPPASKAVQTSSSCPPAPATTKAASSEPMIVPDSAEGHVIANVQRLITASGHACTLGDNKTLVCDKDDPQKPTLAILYTETSSMPRLVFGSTFGWKAPGTCAKKAAKLNDLNRNTDFVKAYCNDATLTWSTTLVLPQLGISEKDVATFASWFGTSVQALLAESELVPLLR